MNGLFSTIVICLVLLTNGVASEAKTGNLTFVDRRSEPLHITSDRLVVREKDGVIVFEGHVFVKQADISMSCDKLTVYGKKGTKPSPSGEVLRQIDRVEAEGNVRVVQGNRVASSGKAIYDVSKQTIVLLDSPVVAQGSDRLSGQMITIDLQKGTSVVEGGSEKPVQVILYPSKKKGILKEVENGGD
ncbi:MAG: lipopolysaccharide transport periplasmic protein LptA [Deltaproteobacteria bacterium]|nr:lipopolysaccharide transport periplasmic protein LptA [Deltaproteobacteria bacterium]MBW2067802.1 lipopolysaccharide transport periplasmic protein LptA [Deltaproteobacteria bacterium]